MKKEQLKNMNVQEMKKIHEKYYRSGINVDLCRYLTARMNAEAFMSRGMTISAYDADGQARRIFDTLPEEIQVGE